MNLLKPIRKVVRKIKQNIEKPQKLKEWQSKFTNSKNAYDLDIMDVREQLFLGTHKVDGNINSQERPSKMSNNVINIIYELIESQVDVTIPQPSVKSKTPGYDYQAQMVEDSIKNDLPELGLNHINDVNERITPKQGMSFIWVNWNPDFKHHLYRGELDIRSLHPKQVIPQKGKYNLQSMDYFFIMLPMTKREVKDKWGVDVSEESEQFPEANEIAGTEEKNYNSDNDNVTVIFCYYRENGDIGRYVWVNDIELEDLPKFYQRRLKRCTKCGKVQVGDVCECGNKTFKESIEDTETLTQDITVTDDEGNVIKTIPAMSPVIENGIATSEKPTEIPYFAPTMYPIIQRINVPIDFSFSGESDIDMVRDQQDALKKVVNNIEEKILKGGCIVTMPDTMNTQLTNELYQIIKGNVQELSGINVKDLRGDIQKDLEFAKYLYDSAKSTLGITDAYQGKEDTTAKSGTAKQIQVQQSSGRLQSKQSNKTTAFKELFEIMFEFKLAYYDETRPYVKMGEDNKPEYGAFNKYAFLERDAAGEWYYNTDFMFAADAGQGVPHDKLWIQNTAVDLFTKKAMDSIQLWTILESTGFPMAAMIKKQMQQQQAMNQQTNLNGAINQLTPEEQAILQQHPEILQQIQGGNNANTGQS